MFHIYFDAGSECMGLVGLGTTHPGSSLHTPPSVYARPLTSNTHRRRHHLKPGCETSLALLPRPAVTFSGQSIGHRVEMLPGTSFEPIDLDDVPWYLVKLGAQETVGSFDRNRFHDAFIMRM